MLTPVHTVAMYLGVHVSFQILVFVSFGCIGRSGIAGACDSSVFSCFEDTPYCFPPRLHQFALLLTATRVPFTPSLHQYFLLVVFVVTSHFGFDLHFPND